MQPRLLGVGVGANSLAWANHHVHEASVVLEALIGAATRLLFLVGLLYLGCGTSNLTDTSEGSVDLSHVERA